MVRRLPRALRVAVALLAGCSALAGCRRRPRAQPAPRLDVTGDGGLRAGAMARDKLHRDPAAERLRIALALDVLVEAETRGDWSQAATVVAEPLLLTACGVTAVLSQAQLEAGELGILASRSGVGAPEITLVGDGVAWALSLGRHGAILDVLERRGTGWVVLASAASASPAAWATACGPWQGRPQQHLFRQPESVDIDAVRALASAEWSAYLRVEKGEAAAGYAGPVPGVVCGERRADVDGPPRARVIDLDRPVSAAHTPRAIWVGSGAALLLETWEASFPTTDQPPPLLEGARLVLFEQRDSGLVRVASADGLSSAGEREVCDQGKGRTIVTSTTITILEDVKFAEDSAVVPPSAAGLLDAVAETLKGNPDLLKVEVQGHADGDEADPLPLSQARAEAVRALLLARGIAPGRLVAKGVGDDAPAGPGRGAAARAKNRRVLWVILDRT